jgi:hypothetical protein
MAEQEATVKTPDALDTSSSSSTEPSMIGKMTDVLKANSKIIIIALIAVAAGGFIVAYLLYWLINRFAISKKSYMVNDTKTPVAANVLSKFTGVSSPVSTNGKRFSICFWVYVHDFDKYRGSMRHILHIGDDETTTGSPFFFFGPNDNKMYCGFSPKTDPSEYNSLTTQYDKCIFKVNNYGMVIDYIPSQRWVHVAVVVNEESNGGTMSAYIDGDLVKVVASGNTTNGGQNTLKLSSMNLSRSGSLVIGGSTSDAIGPGFSGLVSSVRMFNYDLNINDVYSDYMKGPIDNLLAKLGLPAYGVRSPVYKI